MSKRLCSNALSCVLDTKVGLLRNKETFLLIRHLFVQSAKDFSSMEETTTADIVRCIDVRIAKSLVEGNRFYTYNLR